MTPVLEKLLATREDYQSLLVHRDGVPPQHRLVRLPLAVLEQRQSFCTPCDANMNGICREQKTKTPAKCGSIAMGVAIPAARCPRGHWGPWEDDEK